MAAETLAMVSSRADDMARLPLPAVLLANYERRPSFVDSLIHDSCPGYAP
jgi:hypothetical protein